MSTSISMLVAGIVLAWFGGEFFVKGGVGLARCLRWPSAVIGVTVAAFGTSSPELLVAIHAAVDGVPQISLGDVLGSNVVNISLVLAIVVALSGMKAEDDGVRRDWAVAVLVPGVVYLLLMDGWFSRIDAAVMMLGFVLWLLAVIRHARRHAANMEAAVEPVSPLKTGFAIVMGLALLIVAAQLVVDGGKGVAEWLGWSPFVVGAVVVAAATSTPELATTFIARMRGHHDVGLGNILGSNIFNVLFVAAVAALIRPYPVKLPEIVPSLAFGVITMLLILPGKGGHLGRGRGLVLLATYAAYLALTLKAGEAAP
ncbi:MAG: calcium/sodium antiporter [Prosthecobacter sp.]|uniref:calcium/sodium antiporter n=1 Tax=Prosthecobacter sp. TaxID=1965333 RepID=UPI0019F4CB52|nr:calcium/sodium antiporter [Prosthecobacter sp.]MBE2282012.1 calcium/sodium antiporter [Prosthecobacter sp.]